MKHFLSVVTVAGMIAFVTGCHKEYPENLSPGMVAFSFQESEMGSSGGRKTDGATPAFASYSIKRADGTLISGKISLHEFNGGFVSQPEQLESGHYTLEHFLILDRDDRTIYASPIAGSELADLVVHPLPLSFDIAAEELTSVVPEVLGVANHEPGEFGYVAFAFEVVEVFYFDIAATIADNATHSSIDYNLEIVAKDAALGDVKWTKTIAMHTVGSLHIPAKYGHYTFRATKQGYIPHAQHILKNDLTQLNDLTFEFLPESLNDFIVRQETGATVYMAKNPCKLYARVDLREGYQLSYFSIDRTALDNSQSNQEVADFRHIECFLEFSHCNASVNLYGNLPYRIAEDYCASVDLSRSILDITMDDVFYSTFFYMDTNPDFFSDSYTWWTKRGFGGTDLN